MRGEVVKNVCSCPRSGYKNCPSRERGQKMAKFCPLSCWMPPLSHALSFYRSQNSLCWSNFFVSDQNLFLPCPSTSPKIISAGPNFLCQTKIYLDIVPVLNLFCKTKRWFAFSKFSFSAGTKMFGATPTAVQFLVWHKIFRPAQNILGPIEGQGMSN